MWFYCYSRLIRTQVHKIETLIWKMYFLFYLHQERGTETVPLHSLFTGAENTDRFIYCFARDKTRTLRHVIVRRALSRRGMLQAITSILTWVASRRLHRARERGAHAGVFGRTRAFQSVGDKYKGHAIHR